MRYKEIECLLGAGKKGRCKERREDVKKEREIKAVVY
jgi:hypothetical protein